MLQPTEIDVYITDKEVCSSRPEFACGAPQLLVVNNLTLLPHRLALVFTKDTYLPRLQSEITLVDASHLPPGATHHTFVSFHPSLIDHPLELACGLPGHPESSLPVRVCG